MKTKNVIFGIHPVLEALNEGKEFERIFLQKGIQSDQLSEVFKVCKKRGIPAAHVPKEKLNRITGKNHQGVIGITSEIIYQDIKDIIPQIYEKGETPLLLILDRVTDVRNFGAIARTAECVGVQAIIIPHKGSASLNEDAMKTSAGALNKIPICRMQSLTYTVTYLKESGIKIIGCTEKTSDIDYRTDFRNEETGLSKELMEVCDAKAKLPILGTIGSFNVSVAAGIILYEAIKQRADLK